MENPMKESKPCYKRELSIYEKETLQKIENFRSARSNWISNNASKKSTVDEGLKEANIYRGRSKFLWKYGISTARLRIHFKTLRPLRFYTLKRQLSYDDVEKSQLEKPKQKKNKHTCSDIELWPAEEPPAKMKRKDRKKLKRKKAKCPEMKMPVPCKQALKRLKAAKLEQSMIESCRCDDGREVTVVIKGICLCDKNSLNNLKLDKVCDEYSRKAASLDKEPNEAIQKGLPTSETETNVEHRVEPKPQVSLVTETQKAPQETNADEAIALRTVSSLEIYKKKLKSQTEHVAPQEDEISETKSKKAVVFDKEELNKPEEKRKIVDSELTIYPRFSNKSFDTESTIIKPEMDKAEKINEGTSELHVVNSIEIYKKKLSRYSNIGTNPLEADTKKSTNQLKPKKQEAQLTIEHKGNKVEQKVSDVDIIKRHHYDADIENHGTKAKQETGAKDSELKSKDLMTETLKTEKLRTTKTNDENDSTVTLYKNSSEQKSQFALTPEQMKVLKENENSENKEE